MRARPKAPLRTGYTTGSCAAAAAKAATIALRSQRPVSSVEIRLPGGETAQFDVPKCEVSVGQAECCIIKDAGDDPDVTHGAEIWASVRWLDRPGLVISGGTGVGVVTKPGLGLEPGSPAINPVPRRMINYSVEEALGEGQGRGVEILISVPKGVDLARKTLNERLGIVGGISILGTTGIVRPFSTSAYKACIVQALNVALAGGSQHVVLTTGGRTEKAAQRLVELPPEAFIQMGDYVGFTLKQSASKGISKITIVAMIGKLTKIAAGVSQTHASRSRVDADFLAAVALECGLPSERVEQVRESNTARHFSEILNGEEARPVYERLCHLAAEQCHAHGGGKLTVDCFLVDFDGQVLARGRAI